MLENGATAPSSGFAPNAAAPTANSTGTPGEGRAHLGAAAAPDPDDRHLDRLVDAERPRGNGAVDEHRARTGRGELAHGFGSGRAGREQHRGARDAAVARAVEEALERVPTRHLDDLATREATTGAATTSSGPTAPPSGGSPEASTRSPARRRTWTVGLRPRESDAATPSTPDVPAGAATLP